MKIVQTCVVVLAALVCISTYAQTSGTSAKASADMSHAKYTVIRSVEFAHQQGIKLVADMYLPHGSGPFPAIVFIHGGGWRNGNRRQLRRQAAYMAAHGMVGMAIEYRLAPDHPFPAAVKDSRAAVEWLRKHAAQYHVDPRRIAAIGSSAGGNLAADLGVESRMSRAGKGANVEAVVSFNGIYDMAAMRPSSMISDFLGKPCKETRRVCRKASPTDHVRAGEPPFLILHGTADKTAPYSQADAFVNKLRKAGVPAQLFTAKGAPHTFWAYKRWYKPSQQAMYLFLAHVFLPSDALSEARSACGTESCTYLKKIYLPRTRHTGQVAQNELERVILQHNQALTENPAAKNRDRIVYPSGPERYHPVHFPVAEDVAVVDGSGRVLGHLASSVKTVELNFGQRKQIDGRDYVMAFATWTMERGGVTGWIPLQALLPSPERSQFAGELAMDVKDTAAGGDAPESYTVKCDRPGKWNRGHLKVLPHIDNRRNKHVAASDYVLRPDGVCYLLTSLPGHGGVAADILSDGIKFIPSAGIPRVEVPLYLPSDAGQKAHAEWREGKLPHWMEFRYGRVGTRYGWIPSADLQR